MHLKFPILDWNFRFALYYIMDISFVCDIVFVVFIKMIYNITNM